MAKRTLLDLADDLEKEIGKIEEGASGLAIKIATTVVTDLAFVTPVDESTAISNWLVHLDAPSRQEIDAHYPGAFGSTFGPSSQQTIAEAKAVLAGKRPGQAIYISNNVPYIRDLNGGSSMQAPAGFVERAILLGRKMREQGL